MSRPIVVYACDHRIHLFCALVEPEAFQGLNQFIRAYFPRAIRIKLLKYLSRHLLAFTLIYEVLILAENHQELVEVNRVRLVLIYRPDDFFENFRFNLDAELVLEQRLQLFGIDAAGAVFIKQHESHSQFILSHFAYV